MNSDFVAVFENARESDNHIGRLVRHQLGDMAPSKAHLKRLATRGLDDFVDPPKIREISQIRTREQSERMMRFHQQVKADLGGSPTVKPSFDGTYYNAQARGLLQYVEPVQKSPAVPFTRQHDDTFAERKRLYKATQSELNRMNGTEHQPSLLDIIEFGS